jgi:hypothetical protein
MKAKYKDDVASRISNLTEKGNYGICPPPMKAQVAVNELCRYLLGEDWYTTMPLGIEQCNTEIVYAIEKKYKRIK